MFLLRKDVTELRTFVNSLIFTYPTYTQPFILWCLTWVLIPTGSSLLWYKEMVMSVCWLDFTETDSLSTLGYFNTGNWGVNVPLLDKTGWSSDKLLFREVFLETYYNQSSLYYLRLLFTWIHHQEFWTPVLWGGISWTLFTSKTLDGGPLG